MANLSSTTPTAPTGKTNVTWATDGLNISASVPAASVPAADITGILSTSQLPVIPNTQISGLGTASTHAATDFDASGSATTAQAASLQKTANLSDVASVPTARANLGLGTASTHAATDFDAAGSATTAQAAAIAAAESYSNNASNMNSGTVPPNQIPTPTSSTLGGVRSLSSTAHLFLTGISTSGVATTAQPAASDISGLSSAATATPAALTESTSNILTITGGSAALLAATSITVSKASSSAAGYLSAADWNAFNSGAGGAAGSLQALNDLSDLPNVSAARGNLGLGSAALSNTSAFDAAGAANTALTSAESFTTSAVATALAAAEAFSANASNITSGTLASGHLPGTIAANTTGNAATATTASAVPASGISGTLATAQLPTIPNTKISGLGTASTQSIATFAQTANNLSDLASAATALTNLGTDTQYKLYFNVKAFGALGNGTTDDTAAIASAISAANTAGGGTVFFPAGTYLTGTQLIYSNITYQGAGMDATILKLKPATNSDLFQGSITGYTNGVNCYTGTTALVNMGVPSSGSGQGNTSGCYQWQIRDMTLDGNMTNQTAYGCGVRVYGYAYSIENCHIHDFFGDGLYLDFCATISSGSELPVTEARLTNLFIYNLGYNGNGSSSGVMNASAMGIRLAGPTDSQWSNIIVAYPACHAVHIGPRAGATQIQGMHLWGCYKKNAAVGMLLEGFVLASGLEVECAANGSPNIAVISSGNTLLGGKVFGAGISNANSYGIQLGAQATDVNFIGAVQAASPNNLSVPATSTMTATYGSSNKIDMPIQDCYPGAFYLRYEKNNDVSSLLNTYAGSMANPTTAPSLSSVVAGSLAGATYYVKYTYVNATGETTPSSESTLTVAANSELVVTSPSFISGMLGWNVYIGLTSGSETKQNGSTSIAYGTNYTVATGSLVAGSALPTANTTNLMYVTAGQSQPAASTGLWSASDTVVINSNALVQNSNAGGTGIVQFSCDYANPAFSVSNGSWQPFKVRTAGGPYAENSAYLYASFLATFQDYYGSTISSRLDHYGTLYLKNSGIALGTSPSATTLTTGATVSMYRTYILNTNEPPINYDGYFGCNNSGAYHWGKVRVTAASAVTGLVMQATVLVGASGPSTVSPVDGTETTICNESAYALTFAATGSNVSVASYVIPANSARKFIFNTGLYLWMPMS